MDRTVDALKALYVALGGSADNFDAVTIPDAINLIVTVATSGSGASLPAVTAEDNGKVLAVVDGEWAAKTIG